MNDKLTELGVINTLLHLTRYGEEALETALAFLPEGHTMKPELNLKLQNLRESRLQAVSAFEQYATEIIAKARE
jgi:hypothetical protein